VLGTSRLRLDRAKDLIVRSRALIFDVDGTLAETEEVHRQAFNTAFFGAHLDWCWEAAVYKDLLRVASGKERIRAFEAGRRCSRTPRSLHCTG
jgi:FMN phosphatase YigB (HAD superfamily)